MNIDFRERLRHGVMVPIPLARMQSKGVVSSRKDTDATTRYGVDYLFCDTQGSSFLTTLGYHPAAPRGRLKAVSLAGPVITQSVARNEKGKRVSCRAGNTPQGIPN